MNWTKVPAGEINAANQRLWGALGDSADKVATRINTDPAFVEGIARWMLAEVYESSPLQEKVREIMGKNFFGVKEAIKHFGVTPSKQQLIYLAKIPFTEDVLESCKDTHVLVAVFPMSILDICGKVERNLFHRYNDARLKQVFVQDKGDVGWRLVRKVPVDDLVNKTWSEQQALLPKEEEIPKAQVMVYTIIGHFLATGERLFENIYLRCLDLESVGNRICVGNFNAEGLYVDRYWDTGRSDYLGVSAVRKHNA